jgi:hypothetical protein
MLQEPVKDECRLCPKDLLTPTQEFRQLGDIRRNPSRLILADQLGSRASNGRAREVPLVLNI